MRRFLIATHVALIALCLFGLIGCGKGPSVAPATTSSTAAAPDEHAHHHEGPHGGHVIELGSESHHAELTHDEAEHRVGIYVLDGEAKAAAPIDAESVTINVSEDGKPTQYILPAAPQPGEAAGASSYFELVSEPLCAIVCGESAAPDTRVRVSITIDGKPYVGMIETGEHEHDHDHAHGHDHAH
jgi:hypothetical protein